MMRKVTQLASIFALLGLATLVITDNLRGDDEPAQNSKPAAKDKAEAQPASKPEIDPNHAKQAEAGLALFKSDVRAILKNRCLHCHGGDETEAQLDLATRAGLIRGAESGPVILPGRSADSRLYKLITHAKEPVMPEDDDKMPAAEIAAVAKWIDLGAPYDQPLIEQKPKADWRQKLVSEKAREYWAFQPLGRPSIPLVQKDSWSKTDIDRFVLAKLREKGIAPSAPATRRQLIRRASYDLLGLPPDPAEVERFVSDKSPDAWPNLIDRLLESPHYGERWGRHWLDVARFAESHGFEQDYDRPYAFHYRDFVIKALNADMPFDQFAQWQLAGDELAPDNPLAMMATGFLGAGVFPTQITKNEVERTRYDALDDMAATTGNAFLGMSIGCARCHDHKFDPIPQADYYRFASIFTTTVRSNIDLNLGGKDYNLAKAKHDARGKQLTAELTRIETQELPQRFEAWAKQKRPSQPQPAWILVKPSEIKAAGGAKFTHLADGSLLASGANPASDEYTIRTTVASPLYSVRIEVLPDDSLPRKGPGRAGNGNFGLSRIWATLQPTNEDQVELKFASAQATYQQNNNNLSIAASLDDVDKTGWAVDGRIGKPNAAVFELHPDSQQTLDSPTPLTIRLKFAVNTQHGMGRFRISLGTQAGLKPQGEARPAHLSQALAALAKPGTKLGDLSKPQYDALFNHFKQQDQAWRDQHKKLAAHNASAPKPSVAKVMVTSEGFKPIRHHTQGADFFKETYFLHRGDTDQKQGVAQPGFLQVLMRSDKQEQHWQQPAPQGSRTSHRRAALARWITDTEYGAGSLLARVIVNRLWQHHLGRGIVATPNDFGVQGEKPSHPELLDFLARQLIADGWRLKTMHKRIMTSAVYMQDSKFDAARLKLDSVNQYQWRYQPRRLEAEIIRDALLSASGALDPRMFGKGTLNDAHRRRSIYFTIKRSKLVPMMQLFDTPEPLVSVGRRPSTTIAPQALLLLNNKNVRDYARTLAGRLAPAAKESPAAAIKQGYMICVSRPPSPTELSATETFLTGQTAAYKQAGKTNADQLALTDLAQVLLSLNEFVYID